MRMNTLINKFKVIRYFIKNGIFNEERAIVYLLWRDYIVDHPLNICVLCTLFKNHIVLERMI